VFTPEMIKRYPAKLEPFDYSWAPEGTVIICFTSGSRFSLRCFSSGLQLIVVYIKENR